MVNKELSDFIVNELFEGDEDEGKYFHKLASILTDSGYNNEDAKELLSGLFYNVANQYGG